MKIKTIHFQDVGPLGDQSISFVNDWDDSLELRALLSGPNGCGKSTVLRAVAMLWEALGYWLDHRKPLPKSHVAREWLQRWSGCAVVFVPYGTKCPYYCRDRPPTPPPTTSSFPSTSITR